MKKRKYVILGVMAAFSLTGCSTPDTSQTIWCLKKALDTMHMTTGWIAQNLSCCIQNLFLC